MASVIFKPAGGQGRVDVRAGGQGQIYTFEPGVVHDVPQEHLAAVTAALQTSTGTLAAPAQPALAVTGGAAGAFTYYVVGVNANGDTLPSPVRSTAVGPTTLDPTHYNDISWTPLTDPSVTGYRVIRSAGGLTQGAIGGLLGAGVSTLRDNGLVAQAYVPAGAAPGTSAVVAGPPEV